MVPSKFHAVNPSELAFRLATIGAFREAFKFAKGVTLEPIVHMTRILKSLLIYILFVLSLMLFGDSRSNY
ncbi:uncharacterized protein LACBIDRAFT_309915 [Laccaria bicolor S238N-H82]|uniref:Predicted protein n=1 Tax=Laccaria bicolor (strain S238N-H82 / ATCC MYA-4686) TaxID=486041 RepID=B0DTC2_LACBS|nr:uncharacterized protein LACBIDRAFT_309915 [Laccaria bicolor S238N-H82]EDR02249.1 predicted protein [Laccaria bicolor S238N-H82]|eukprot:XP_001887194.1 predicted protein [Laccaria bicolor S238N-H82]